METFPSREVKPLLDVLGYSAQYDRGSIVEEPLTKASHCSTRTPPQMMMLVVTMINKMGLMMRVKLTVIIIIIVVVVALSIIAMIAFGCYCFFCCY